MPNLEIDNKNTNDVELTNERQEFEKKLEAIVFDKDAYNWADAKATLQFKQEFDGNVQEWNKLAELLDRYDPFSKLLIEPSAYQEKVFEGEGEDISYGIRYDAEIHDDGVILKHQIESTAEFLKKHRGFGLLADVVGSGKTFEAGLVLSELAIRGYISSMLLIVPKDVYNAWVSAIEKLFGLGKCVKDKNGNPIKMADDVPATFVRVGDKLEGKHFNKEVNGFITPKYPIIVTMDDFVKWEAGTLDKKLFDVVVVDEAHHLNCGEGDDAKAMMLLSHLMHTKQLAKKTYCLLLSATPHSGNLEDMFRLWYFIRCKGGKPEDFDPTKPDELKSPAFLEERNFYLNDICRGANTVKDFVRKEKIATVRGDFATYCVDFYAYVKENCKDGKRSRTVSELSDTEKQGVIDSFLSTYLADKGYCDREGVRKYIYKHAGESVSRDEAEIRTAFNAYLTVMAAQCDPNERENYARFDYSYDGNKERVIDEFLRADERTFNNLGLTQIAQYAANGAMRQKVEKMIADLYHNTILRSIMIRQPDDRVKRTSKKRKVVNLMMFRTNKAPQEEIRLDFPAGETAVVKINPKRFDYMDDRTTISREKNGKPVTDGIGNPLPPTSFGEYIEKQREEGGIVSYGYFFEKFMEQFGATDVNYIFNAKQSEYPYRFHRAKSVEFYANQMDAINVENKLSKVHYNFLPVYDEDIQRIDNIIDSVGGLDDPEAREKRRSYYLKCERLKEILRRHENERVIVFFDYLLGEEESVCASVNSMLLNDPDFAGRIIDAKDFNENDETTKTGLTKAFDAKSDAILVVTSKGLTEGTNFQSCSVVVNFQITTDPLAMQQSIGRVFRIGQKNDVTVYSIADMYKLEGYLLAYYSRIGLMSSDTGDAEILAGCNNADMVTMLCPEPRCQHLGLYTKEDCEQLTMLELQGQKPKGGKRQYYVRCEKCRSDKYMLPLLTSNVRCDSCGASVVRTVKEDGVPTYSCVGNGETMSAKIDEQIYYCNKYCAMSKCRKLQRWGCKAIELYRMKKRPATDIKAEACSVCPHMEECEKKGCIYDVGVDAIKKCSTCSENACRNVKPHALVFDQNWETACPKCKKGTLKPEKAKSFDTYIRRLFASGEMDQGESFCPRFMEEIDKVVEVQQILRADTLRERQ